ncbi:BLOC-2 complex member HPS3-like [Antedon mediterranea]|uniref:BLOC-2 complex member HPS3-like n=1 Tax=Antedon mediterranea TaxID=105859 RepID=UPI003AF51296
MVQVYSCHHFTSQEVFTSQCEPLASCSSEEFVFVATARQTVEAHTMTKKGCPLLCTFSTVGIVTDLNYCKRGNFVAALESKSLKQKLVTFTRVYMNWARSAPGQPGRVRVAGHSLRNKKLTTKGDQFEVIEIPTFKSPNSIHCCNLTGNIAIGVDTSVCLFHLREQGTDKVFYDFEHLINIDMGFKILNSAICCNYLACISQNELHIFKIDFKSNRTNNLQNEEVEMGQKLDRITSAAGKSNSFFVEDDDYVSWSFNDVESYSSFQDSCDHNQGFETLLAAVKLDNLSTNKTCLLPSVKLEEMYIDRSSDPMEVLGPIKKVKGHPLKVDLPGNLSLGDDQNDVVLTTLVYRRFEAPENNEDALHSLQFQSTFSGKDILKCDFGCLGSNVEPVGLCCFVSTQTTGALYDVHSNVQLIATYPYTADTKLAVVGRDMIHVVTKNGLETYTSRSFAAAIPNIETIDDIDNTCPPASQEPSLIGLRPFIGIFDMAKSDNHLIMLSKDSQATSDGSWGIYILKDARMVDLYTDIIDLAFRYQTCNVPAYLVLLEEAHLFLRSAMFHSGAEDDLFERFRRTCRLLGDHYAGSDSECPHLALPYYNMSGKELSSIVTDQDEKQVKQYMQVDGNSIGLLCYLNHQLFNQAGSVTLDEPTAEIILGIYMSAQPDKLSSVILESKLKGYSLEYALQLVESLKTLRKNDGSQYIPTAVDIICQAVIQLSLCEPDQARFLLNSVSEVDIIKVFLHRPWLLCKEGQFSSLAQLMRQHNSKLFIEVLIALHDNKSVSLHTTLKLFEGDSAYQNPSNTHLRDYLEAILSARNRQDSHEQAAELLVKIYIQRLNDWKPAQSRMVKGRGHVHVDVGGYFSCRYDWLDDIPPFKGQEALRKPCSKMRVNDQVIRKPSRQMSRKTEDCMDKECHCCCCYEDLIKAQSLLCTTSINLGPHKLILEASDTMDFIGLESLKLLSLSRTDPGLAANLMLENYPNLTVAFVKDTFFSDASLWTDFLETLFDQIRTLKSEKDNKDNLKMYSNILKGVLDLAISSLNHDVFMSVLPNDGAISFFLPYIERCCLRLEASKLRNSIAADLIAKTEMTQRSHYY